MKKVFHIIGAIVILASGLNVSIDHHYCGGTLAGTKLSLTGELASCGMEDKARDCSGEPSIENRCCEDQVTHISLNSKYYPEYFKLANRFAGKIIQAVPVCNIPFICPDVTRITSWTLPPGERIKADITQSGICVFRI